MTTPMLIAALAPHRQCDLLSSARHPRESVNMRGAYLEVLGDLIGSVAVIAAGIVIATTGYQRADVFASLGIGLFILPRAWSLLSEVVHILLESTPKGLDLARVREHIRSVEGVIDVHDLHAWTITSGMPALTAHVVVEDEYLADCADVCDKVSACLAEHFDLEHTTLQVGTRRHLEHERTPAVEGLLGEQADPSQEQRDHLDASAPTYTSARERCSLTSPASTASERLCSFGRITPSWLTSMSAPRRSRIHPASPRRHREQEGCRTNSTSTVLSGAKDDPPDAQAQRQRDSGARNFRGASRKEMARTIPNQTKQIAAMARTTSVIPQFEQTNGGAEGTRTPNPLLAKADATNCHGPGRSLTRDLGAASWLDRVGNLGPQFTLRPLFLNLPPDHIADACNGCERRLSSSFSTSLPVVREWA